MAGRYSNRHGNSSRDRPGRVGNGGRGPLRAGGGHGTGRHGQVHSVTCGICGKRVLFETRNGRTVEVLESGKEHDCPGNQIRAMERMRRVNLQPGRE
jgi:hypothetical protein